LTINNGYRVAAVATGRTRRAGGLTEAAP
jgi:hypothetical protein